MALLTEEDRSKQRGIQAQYGEDCAFFAPPGLGFLAVVPPEKVAEHYWKFWVGMSQPGVDKTAYIRALALEFVAEPDRERLGAFFNQKPAFVPVMGATVRKLCGEREREKPELEAKDEKELVASLAKKHGEVTWYRPAGIGLVVVAAPENPASYRQFFNDVANNVEKEKPEDVFVPFALDCVVHPVREKVLTLFARKPGLAKAISDSGQVLCGGDIEELGKV